MPTSLKWGPFAILVFWLVVMGLLYAAMTHYLKPKPVTITASGDLVIPRSRDGHFYAAGSVNGKPANFLVDTGASLVTVSEPFARAAGIAAGVPTVFKTANGDLAGWIVSGVSVTLGPMDVSGVRVGVGLVGGEVGDALLGQSFLSKFEITLSKEQMTLRQK
ncbi:MAG: retropepsin-like aspartic protease [Rhodoferax sp.]